jgi:hypothetical protein
MNARRKIFLTAFLLSPLLAGASFLAIPRAHAAAYAPAGDPLLRLNREFLTAYQALVRQTIPRMSPVVVQCGDSIVLVRHGTTVQAPAFGRRYRELEAVSHVPVTAYVLLVPRSGTSLDRASTSALISYRDVVAQALEALPHAQFTASELPRQQRMLAGSLAFLTANIRAGRVSEGALRRFARRQAPDILADVHAAAADQIHTMRRQLTAWLGSMPNDERTKLKAAVCGVHMQRIGNLTMQFLAKTMGLPYEGRYQEEARDGSNLDLVYAESVFDATAGRKLLAEHAIDSHLGRDFFADPARMHRDLLGDAAQQILSAR